MEASKRQFEPSLFAMNYWDENDITDNLIKYAPDYHGMKIKSTEEIGSIINSTKYTSEKYPFRARPVHTKLNSTLFNSLSGRMGKRIVYRKIYGN